MNGASEVVVWMMTPRPVTAEMSGDGVMGLLRFLGGTPHVGLNFWEAGGKSGRNDGACYKNH